MKRILLLTLLLCLLTACSKKETAVTESTQPSTRFPEYTKAPELYEVDTNLYDPSNQDVKFRIDDEGYLISYTYKVDGQEHMVTLSYEGRKITIFAFNGNELIDARVIEAKSDFDPEIGITEYEGYYIRGYVMS